MEKQEILGYAFKIIIVIIMPLLIWGLTVEKKQINNRIIENSEKIRNLKTEQKESNKLILKNHDEIMKGLHDIELQLKDKKDRE